MIPHIHPEQLLGLDLDDAARCLAALGGAHADLFAEDRSVIRVRLEDRTLRVATQDQERGLALRVLDKDGSTRLVSSTRLDPHTVRSLAAELGGTSASAGAPAPGPRPSEPPLEMAEPIGRAQLADRIARSLSPLVRQVSISLSARRRRTLVLARGEPAHVGQVERANMGVEVIAERNGTRASAYEAVGAPDLIGLNEAEVERCALLAGRRALRLLDARPALAGEMPVVLAAEAGGTFVHEAVGHALEADAVLEGLSVFEDQLGQTIAAPIISVADDATLPGGNGSFGMDDEGVAGERTLLIDRGQLVAYLQDRRSALLLGARPNGKGRRESFRHRPVVRMSNTLILPGPHDPAAILRETERGLYVVRMGGGEVDTLTGRFVFEVNEAYRIEGGALGDLVRGATLTGSAVEVLNSIDRVGNDMGYGIGTCGKDGQDVPVSDGEPTLRVPRLVVGGTA